METWKNAMLSYMSPKYNIPKANVDLEERDLEQIGDLGYSYLRKLTIDYVLYYAINIPIHLYPNF